MKTDEFKDRLARVIESQKSVNDFALKCELSESVVRAYLTGKSLPGLDKFVKMAQVAGVREQWLATGEGPRNVAAVAPQVRLEWLLRVSPPSVVSNLLGITAEHLEELFNSDKEISKEISEKLYQLTSMIEPIPHTNQADSASNELVSHVARISLPVRKHPELDAVDPHFPALQHVARKTGTNMMSLLAIENESDAMHPLISSGDTVVVDSTKSDVSAMASGMYFISVDALLEPRYIERKSDGSILLKCENPAYEDELVPRENAGGLYVIGKVIWIGHRV
jgi:phage repressor protein C with HTH and peptisase S24 domain